MIFYLFICNYLFLLFYYCICNYLGNPDLLGNRTSSLKLNQLNLELSNRAKNIRLFLRVSQSKCEANQPSGSELWSDIQTNTQTDKQILLPYLQGVPHHSRLSQSFNAKIFTEYSRNLVFSALKFIYFSHMHLKNDSFFLNIFFSPLNFNLELYTI